MKPLRRELENEEPKEAGLGRRNFLRRAGMAAAVVGGLEAVGMTSAMAATSSKYSAAKASGSSYPRAGKPGPNTRQLALPRCSAGQCTITWTCTPGECGSACPHPEWCYHWTDSCGGSGHGCAWSNCATHVTCGPQG
ncbi:MAG TPA: hypothetical protein VGM14_12100 [Streptosporangiaceae bacterium]